jgi:hypothetical protein
MYPQYINNTITEKESSREKKNMQTFSMNKKAKY